MARYIKNFQTNVDFQAVHSAVNQYLQSEGYEYINYDGENVFKKGNGVWASPTFFKFSYSDKMVKMETWMKYAFFPGVYIGELGVDGFVGCAVKGAWKKRIGNLESILSNFAMQTTYYSPIPTQNNIDDNATKLLNDTDNYEETCILDENKVEPVVAKSPVFCNGCGNQMLDGALFCSVCGQKCPNINIGTVNVSNVAQDQQASFNATNEDSLPPACYHVSRKEFINKYAQPSLRKNITSIAILCYICAGLTFVVSCLLNPLGIIDALILAGLALGMQLTKSRIFAILILVFSIIEVLLSLASGSFPLWWLVAGISAMVTFSKIEKQYKQFTNR